MDNAPPHLLSIDKEIEAAAVESGLVLRIKRQPANSPDMNLIDLGFFNTIQSVQNKHPTKNVDELITVLKDSYNGQQRSTADAF